MKRHPFHMRWLALPAFAGCGLIGNSSGLDIVGPERPCAVTITLYACDPFNAMDMGPPIYQETETILAVSGRAACAILLPEVLADFAKMDMGVEVGLKVCTANCAPVPSGPPSLKVAQSGTESLDDGTCGPGVCPTAGPGCGGSSGTGIGGSIGDGVGGSSDVGGVGPVGAGGFVAASSSVDVGAAVGAGAGADISPRGGAGGAR